MKYKTCLFVTAFLAAAGTAQAQNILKITQVGESPTPVVTYNGSPVTLNPVSTLFKDNWTLVLPDTFALASQGQVLVGEPEDATRANILLVGTQPTTIVWSSDQPIPPGSPTPLDNPLTIVNAGTFSTPSGGQKPFNFVVAENVSEGFRHVKAVSIG